ncbi:hypothetical protein [Pelagibacterium luteolum]|uniref:Uncharacterized protein n=1 Tax=Pelagibacterium luteolum TaxID=440168 RepID=A0A1G7SCX3_9HYPH|nr:hypothetical protein [Pelagibacterium luteolum]SDG20907.1 hypothetical protein SAMN04487974_101440 [Pelagibacterium luteolum]
MILIYVLLAGSGLWAFGEIVMLSSGQAAAWAGWMATIGLYVAGAGMFALKDLPAMAKPGRVGIALSAFGAFSFATVYTIILTAGVLGAMADGTIAHAQMVYTPFYLLALAFAASGLVSLGLHFRALGDRAGLAGATLLAILSLGRLILADVAAYHEAVSILVAAYFFWLGIRLLRQRAR